MSVSVIVSEFVWGENGIKKQRRTGGAAHVEEKIMSAPRAEACGNPQKRPFFKYVWKVATAPAPRSALADRLPSILGRGLVGL
ncbi:hypothetical protein N7476_004970 [Penicillium atrosanguineum]|uniref:Uncharacterized protein n=1 Tax=Penicillium atrosanguineum TaxID=1132637 RepID=A0A9W9U5P6_9EURO|nr:hypothetical protein N7476_004970 [Penicillium atrosanguineum]